jgi:propanediol dehydratase small subunit
MAGKKKVETYTTGIERYNRIMALADNRIGLKDKRVRPDDIKTQVVIDTEAGTVTMPINVARGLNLVDGRR